MNAELNELNAKIRHNVAAQEKAAQARRDAAKEAKFAEALMGCRFPVVLTLITWITVSMGLATPVLGWIVTLPSLCGVCYQAGTAK